MARNDDTDQDLLLRRCMDLARLGRGHTRTNPMVGAVVLSDDVIIGEGYHRKFGGPHAEVVALDRLPLDETQGSHIYVSMEPCNHTGKTPPCTALILAKKVQACTIGHLDVNSSVSGKGLVALQNAGLRVTNSGYIDVGKALNRAFFKNQKDARPYIVLKWAQSRDGFLGRIGQKTPISNEWTRRLVHKWRSECDSVMIGSNTALVDDPQLGNRFFFGAHPWRIVLDRRGRLSPTAKILQAPSKTIIVGKHRQKAREDGVRLIPYRGDLCQVIQDLYMLDISSILVEGGRELLESFIDLDLWDECRVITSPVDLHDGIRAPEFVRLPRDFLAIGSDKIAVFIREN